MNYVENESSFMRFVKDTKAGKPSSRNTLRIMQILKHFEID